MTEEFPILHQRILRIKTGEWLEKVRKIVPPDFDVKEWAKSFNREIVASSMKPLDDKRSLATVVLK